MPHPTVKKLGACAVLGTSVALIAILLVPLTLLGGLVSLVWTAADRMLAWLCAEAPPAKGGHR